MNKIKKSIYLIIIFFIFLTIFFLNKNNDFKVLKRETIYPILKVIKNNEILKYKNLGYKNIFLPNTVYGKITLSQKKVELNNTNYSVNYGYGKNYYKPFYIENYKGYIYIIERNGNMLKISSKDLDNNKDNLDGIKIKSDIKKFNNIHVLDTLIIKDEIFISFRIEDSKCKKFKIIKSKIEELLKFQTIFEPTECGNNIQAGSMQYYNLKRMKVFYFHYQVLFL